MIEGLCSSSHPWWIWGAFIALILVFILVDIKIFHKKTHAVTVKEALIWTAVWFGTAMIFNFWIFFECGAQMGLQFFTGYIIEKSLSVDNLFVILLVFTSFGIVPKYQHRVLFWGILGALIMRGGLILAGAALVARFDWVFYLFGIFLVWTGAKMFKEEEEEFDPKKSKIVRLLKKIIPVSHKNDGEHFFVRERGKMAVTIMFVALIVVEVTDLVFAFDSIPAIFAISTDPFIVFTSNVFAILGLRSLYFVIAKAHELFTHLKTGLAIILVFIGLKLLLKDLVHINIFLSLGVVLAVLLTSILYSIWENKREENIRKEDKRIAKANVVDKNLKKIKKAGKKADKTKKR